MKIAALAFAGLASANINFHWVQPTCDFTALGQSKCLRGQHCTEDNTCAANVSNDQLYPRSFRRSVPEKRQTKYSTDGTCGPANGNTLCDPKSTVYTGTCCSSYGWCGNTPAHCGTGCISGCGGAASSVKSSTPSATAGATAPRDDGRCGKDFAGATCDPKGAYGGCCSSYGYCGSTDGHCLPANGCQNGCKGSASSTGGGSKPTSASATRPPSTTTSGEPVLGNPSTIPNSQPTGKATTDGSCGATFGNTVCGNWPQGACCSMYGYCGNTTAHCGDGCQSGPCANAPVQPAPGPSPAPAAAKPGSLATVGRSGVPAMHAGLMPNGRVVFLDKVENYTELKLANGQYAYSSEYDPATNKVVPLGYKTNAFCSGGIFLADGRFVSLGGNAPLDFIDPTVGDGFRGIRYLKRSATDASLNGQAWSEPGQQLNTARWYASAQIMADSSIFVASGSLNGLDPAKPENNNPTYEILNADGTPRGKSVTMDILSKNQPYYMYPFMHLMKDGNVFVFVAKSSEIFNVGTGTTVRKFADLPGDYRTYPNTGGSVMLPLSSGNQWNPDIVVCGGGPYQDVTAPSDASCGRIQPLATNPGWELDSMPEGRVMVEGTLLADGTVIWVNGANRGAQGFGIARDPTLEVLIYDPVQPLGKRWTTGAKSAIPRLYHSVALLLLDGTLMITGSNPVEQPKLKADNTDPYVTEFRVEIYTPPYLQGNPTRPKDVVLSSKTLKADGSTFTIKFTAPANAKAVKVSLYYGGFVTHSVHMGHRMAFLDTKNFKAGSTAQTITVTMPPNKNVAPPGPYVVYVLVDGVPAIGQFVQVS
ncbi:glyoxal oxidase [Polyplosphaeria fusca]|uniref:Glyoxal oxidase n=1 Tax=Polyplosphaeria fusca TaxID=682080 RepID=A0A9P4QYH5_9PLEO|nr:glyoxal oxidase [Polyplosphaeria fusca]